MQDRLSPGPAEFPSLVDLAAADVGGRALAASDEFFAEKENLLRPGPASFDPARYTERGKWMDGWESRRKRDPGHDWCVVELGIAGIVRAVDVDTSHFLGNHPAEASLDLCAAPSGSEPEGWAWHPLAPRFPLHPGRQNLFAVASQERAAAVRLNIFPDGGVARLRVWGDPRPDLPEGGVFDLAALVHGGRAVACSDMFFGRKGHLILPGAPADMGGGWETRRRRGPGHDWAVIRLATRGVVERIEVDTMHFKGNYPDRCSVDACCAGCDLGGLDCDGAVWQPLAGETKLGPHQVHELTDLADLGPVDHVRLNIFPDGGVARLRVWGQAAS
ncbi:MAG: allantoicase [Thermoanaerobaculia bacterium]|nr:allantoicase [Thermoanaerobaculia bacterium]